jgi:hypothetical protein
MSLENENLVPFEEFLNNFANLFSDTQQTLKKEEFLNIIKNKCLQVEEDKLSNFLEFIYDNVSIILFR